MSRELVSFQFPPQVKELGEEQLRIGLLVNGTNFFPEGRGASP